MASSNQGESLYYMNTFVAAPSPAARPIRPLNANAVPTPSSEPQLHREYINANPATPSTDEIKPNPYPGEQESDPADPTQRLAGEPTSDKKRTETSKPSASADHKIQYSVQDVPPWYLSIVLGFQHYLIMFGGTVSNPMMLSKALCVDETNQIVTSELIGTIFFVSGICTLLQATFGVRLPIVQGGTYTFILSGMAILSLDKWKCPTKGGSETHGVTQGYDNSTSWMLPNQTSTTSSIISNDDIWKPRIREIQGAIIVASLFQVFIGFTGIMGFLFRFIGPLSIAPTIALAGLSLFPVAIDYASTQWWIALVTIVLIAAFSQYTKRFEIPCFKFERGVGCVRVGFPLFSLFPVILAVVITWIICAILTATNVFPTDETSSGSKAATGRNIHVMREAAWFRIPYPGQWGMPTVSAAAVFGMLSAVLASMIESVGDYYACARMSQVSPPPIHAINRGITIEGLGCVLAGLIGSGTGTTSYSENIGAIGITKVASRRVMQVGALIMILFGVLGKFGAVFVTIPQPIIGGIFTVMFGMIAAVGISNLQFVDLNSSRNLFIIGFSFFFGLALPQYMYANPNCISTGSQVFDQIVIVLLKTSMFVGGLAGFVLDNTIPGTDEERGMIRWRDTLHSGNLVVEDETPADVEEKERVQEEQLRAIYDIPLITKYLRKYQWTKYVPIFPTFDEELFSLKRLKKSGKNRKHSYDVKNKNDVV